MNEGHVDAGRRYVDHARAHGRCDRDIRKTMLAAGWTRDEIDRLLAAPRPPNAHGGEAREKPRLSVPVSCDGVSPGAALGDAFVTLWTAPVPLLLTGFVTGLVAVSLPRLTPRLIQQTEESWEDLTDVSSFLEAIDPSLIFPALFSAPGFACLCVVALRVMRGKGSRLPRWEEVRRVALPALLVGAVAVAVVGAAALGPLAWVAADYGVGSSNFGWFQGLWRLWGSVLFMIAVPFCLAFTYLLAVPIMSLSLPAVADGAGVGQAFSVSFSRGISNVPPLAGVGIVGTVAFRAVLFVHDHAMRTIVDNGGGLFHHPTAQAEVLATLLVAVEVALFAPWLAAVVSSAYIQATGGGSRR